MSLIVLHDHINPNQPVYVDTSSIAAVRPFGSGSVLSIMGGDIAVHETPAQVAELMGNVTE